MRKKWIKHHIRQQVRRIACAVLLFKDGFAQKRPETALHFLRSDSQVLAFPAVGSALPSVGFKDTASHDYFYDNPYTTARA